MHVGEVEVDRRRPEAVVAQDLLHRRQADPLLQGRRGEHLSQPMRTHVLGDPRAVGHRFDDVLGTSRLDQERLLQREGVPKSARTRWDIGTTRTLVCLPWEPPLPLIRSWCCC